MKKIIKSNIVNLSPIIKSSDILILENVKQYRANMEEKIDKLLLKNKEKCKQMEDEIIDRNQLLFEQKIIELFNYTSEQLDTIFEQISADFYTLVYKILSKLGFNNMTHENIANIIKDELFNYIKDDNVKIICNENACNTLKEQLLNTNFNYKIDNQFDDNQCLIETKLYSFKINISQCLNVVNNLLQIKNATGK